MCLYSEPTSAINTNLPLVCNTANDFITINPGTTRFYRANSVEMYVKLEEISGTEHGMLFSIGETNDMGLIFQARKDVNEDLFLILRDADQQADQIKYGIKVAPKNSAGYTHIVVTVDDDGKDVKIYLNGVIVDTSQNDTDVFWFYDKTLSTAVWTDSTITEFTVGSSLEHPDANMSNNRIGSIISLFNIYNTILTPNDVSILYGYNVIVENSQSATTNANGGTIITHGNYKVHVFTSSGTFEIVNGGTDIDFLIVGGGGAGGADPGSGWGSGGGGGGYITSYGSISGGGSAVESKLQLSAGTYNVVVGAGGITSNTAPTNGQDSSFASITSLGGGYGGIVTSGYQAGGTGGSGGGSYRGYAGGSGTSNQGFDGAAGVASGRSGGGGGAGSPGVEGDGGDGLANAITGTITYYAGGGGQGQNPDVGGGIGGLGGGGDGNYGADASDGVANTGGGGGGARADGTAGNGGSGIVIIRYKFQ
tara:strand:- start:436 stop:1872 length:1437 start_codon:yes stop_codon:yes gene_type:complete